MGRISAATRISMALACLTITVFLAAQSLGLIPDPLRPAFEKRKELSETIAIYCSLAAQQDDLTTIKAAAAAVRARNAEILSLAVRRADGELVVEEGAHRAHWNQDGSLKSGANQVQVPIFQGDAPWGTVEVRFRALEQSGILAMLTHPVVTLGGFVAVAGFGLYLIYLRRTLRYLDPSAVIPERMRVMLDTLVEPVLVLDKQARIVLANEAFGRIVKLPANELVGRDASALPWTSAESDAPVDSPPWAVSLTHGTIQSGRTLTLRSGSGDLRTVVANCAPIRAGDGETRGALATFDDVTEVEQKNRQLRDTLELLKRSQDEINRQNHELQVLASTDALTKCLNRRSLFDEFEKRWSSARRHGRSLSCVMMDIDHFKRINDEHGHAVGDQALQQVAGLLQSLARASDVVARYGGEEFCILLPDIDGERALRAAERFRQALASRLVCGIAVTASFGVAGIESGAGGPQEMLDQADRALYVAKRRGRNRAVLWNATLVEVLASTDPKRSAGTAGPVASGSRNAMHKGPIPYHAVSALMAALAHRDRATAEHSKRVADLCVATARGLVSHAQCYTIEVAALLHDIGKLGVPDAILLKPGPLTDDDWKVMRTHERIGVEIVAAAFASEEVTAIVRTHHAWYGGTAENPGLPTGQAIPFGARILAIADAFDAMVSDRVYRRARSAEDAIVELRRYAGKQFDPELTERFIGVVRPNDSRVYEGAPSESASVALAIGTQVERLASALDANDISMMAAIAARLAATATRDGQEEIASLASALERAAAVESDLNKVLQLTHQLMELCMSVQKSGANALESSIE